MPGPIALQTDDARRPLWSKLLFFVPLLAALAFVVGLSMHNRFVLQREIDVLMTSNQVWSKLYYDLATKGPTEEESATCL